MTAKDGRMDPAIKERVVAALRDPANKQGRNQLRGDLLQSGDGEGGVCCLELVCQEAIRDGILPPPVFRNGRWLYGDPGFVNSSVLPSEVMKWAGLGSPNPLFDLSPFTARNGYPYSIAWATLNDTLEMPFPQIADMVDYFF